MNPALWDAWFPNRPMPEGCTYEMFVAARGELWRQEDIQFDLDDVALYNDMIARYSEELPFIEDLLAAKSRTLARLTDAGL